VRFFANAPEKNRKKRLQGIRAYVQYASLAPGTKVNGADP